MHKNQILHYELYIQTQKQNWKKMNKTTLYTKLSAKGMTEKGVIKYT